MKLQVSLLIAFALLSTITASAQQRNTLVITGATLIDGNGATPIPDSVVVVREDRIVAAGPRARVKTPRDAKIIDARGKWIIPGLIDAHVHFFQSGGLYTRPDVIDLRQRVSYGQELENIRKRLAYTFTRYLCSGVTSVVDVGGPFRNFEVRDIGERTRAAPRIAVAGPLISTYAPDALKTNDPAIIKVNSAAEALVLLRRLLARKPDLIKIWFIRRPDVSLEEATRIVKAVVDESHAAGVRVAVHATLLETAKAAVAAGCDILVHSVFDREVDDEFVRMVKERGVIYTTTAVVNEGYTEVLGQSVELTDIERECGDPEVIASWSDLAKLGPAELPASARQPRRFTNKGVILGNLKRMVDAGAIVAAGTDAGNIGTLHGPSIHREFELMAEAGLTPMQIIVAATRDAALVFGNGQTHVNNSRTNSKSTSLANPGKGMVVNPQMGTIEPGKLADLIMLDADPLADIRNARKIRTVIKSGRVVGGKQ